MEPKLREGQRVMILPETEEEANAGWEQPEGVVLCPGAWTLVLLDEEFRGTNERGLVEIQEEKLEVIR